MSHVPTAGCRAAPIALLLLHIAVPCALATSGKFSKRHRASLGNWQGIRIDANGVQVHETDETSLMQLPKGQVLVQQNLMQTAQHKRLQRIPAQLILTGRWNSVEELPGPVAKNLQDTVSLNPKLRIRWFSDASCQKYLSQYFDEELANIFAGERRGSFRGDICRAAVLSREGGFYTDLDAQWVIPMQDLVDESTSFMSAYGQGRGEMLNAVMAAEPGNKIMADVLLELRKWYAWNPTTQAYQPADPNQGWMGPVTLMKAFKDLQRESCPELDLTTRNFDVACGPHKMRLYEQRKIHCHHSFLMSKVAAEPWGSHGASPECPPNRARSHFEGTQYGLFEPGTGGKLIGWPRFAECAGWGCDAGGWNKAKPKV